MFKNKQTLTKLIAIAVLAVALIVCSLAVNNVEPHACHDCDGADAACETCGGTGLVDPSSRYEETFMALLPPIIAIALALITKEAYSSLFIGMVIGALLSANYKLSGTLDVLVNDGIISAVSDNAGIFAFLVILGILVCLVNRAGGSQAFGRWAKEHIHTKVGAAIAIFALGVLIFIDDYFNCLTVGSVMAPVTDSQKISRVKLAYLIDATAAPVCMIAPISSWAAAVAGAVEGSAVADAGMSSFTLFVRAIPFNFYSLLTFVFIITITLLGYDYGKMADFEIKAQNGDLSELDNKAAEAPVAAEKGRVLDLILPIAVLIVACVFALVYVGGFFDAECGNYLDFIGAFGDTDAFVALPWGGVVALVFSIVYFLLRKSFGFKEEMECIPNGFIAMVPAILILTFATSLKNITGVLGAKYFVANLMANAADGLFALLPAIIFLVACVLSFSTGTSWGTFGILIPIVTAMFGVDDPLLFVGISACLAGAVCGDHCSPISDTTIMASAGANCNHVNHVETQLPYAITVAGVSFVSFIVAGFVPNAWIMLPVAVVLMVGTIFGIRFLQGKMKKA